jgi:hypothetical protein
MPLPNAIEGIGKNMKLRPVVHNDTEIMIAM